MKEIRVLLLNGSPRANGNTALALREMEKVFAQNGVQTETVLLGNQAIRGCTACGACAKLGRCVFDDAVNELARSLRRRTGWSSPVRSITPRPTRRSSPAWTACFTPRPLTRP